MFFRWVVVAAILYSGRVIADEPGWVSPVAIAREYKKSPAGADWLYKDKEVKVSGLVSSIWNAATGQAVVQFDTDDRIGVACHVVDSEVGKAARIEAGQLIAVQGRSIGMVLQDVVVQSCRIVYQFAGPHKVEPRGFGWLSALSSEACQADTFRTYMAGAEDEVKRQGGENNLRRGQKEKLIEMRRFLAKLEEAKAKLTKPGAQSMPCDGPILAMLRDCERGREGFAECRSPYMREAVKSLQESR